MTCGFTEYVRGDRPVVCGVFWAIGQHCALLINSLQTRALRFRTGTLVLIVIVQSYRRTLTQRRVVYLTCGGQSLGNQLASRLITPLWGRAKSQPAVQIKIANGTTTIYASTTHMSPAFNASGTGFSTNSGPIIVVCPGGACMHESYVRTLLE